jgi:signal transduction histidine kinase
MSCLCTELVTSLRTAESRTDVMIFDSPMSSNRFSYDNIDRHRPPWWPSDEPFPPRSRRHVWRAMRGHFFWRIGVFFAALFFLSVGACTILLWLLTEQLGGVNPLLAPLRIPPALIIVFFVIVVVFLSATGRSLRRSATPLAELMDAADRIADGDYTVRVAERGPRQMRTLVRTFNDMFTKLQATDEQRRSLLADVTHELRTPLTVIQGNLEGLLDGVYPRDDEHLVPILEETRLLSRLIDDLRTLALAESGALKLQKERIDLAELCDEVATSFRSQADEAGVNLLAETNTGLMVEVDPARIREVLENLIANALRYTPRGGTIRVQCSRESENAQVAVADTGAGIPPEDLAHIFTRFYKSWDSRGTGLGLAIAKNLVAIHGGEISAESEVGKGTAMRFTLPTL